MHEQARFSQAVRDAKESKRDKITAEDYNNVVFMNQSQIIPQNIHIPGKQSSSAVSGAGLRSSSATSNSGPNKVLESYVSSCHPIRDLGLAVPPPRLVQPVELSKREHKIYSLPDSDDESIELPVGYVAGPSFPIGRMM